MPNFQAREQIIFHIKEIHSLHKSGAFLIS